LQSPAKELVGGLVEELDAAVQLLDDLGRQRSKRGMRKQQKPRPDRAERAPISPQNR
jgi:hypothetical protein